MAAERAAVARREADQLACKAWSLRMLATRVTPIHELERYIRCKMTAMWGAEKEDKAGA
jgi:hypothetical protein